MRICNGSLVELPEKYFSRYDVVDMDNAYHACYDLNVLIKALWLQELTIMAFISDDIVNIKKRIASRLNHKTAR